MDKSLSTIALIGNPNTGKTSLFNALTGQKQRVGNYPGVTVEKKSGLWKLSPTESLNQGEQEVPGVTRCIFRKPKRRLRLGHWFGVLTVMLGAALLMELQAEPNPSQQTTEGAPLVSQLHHP